MNAWFPLLRARTAFLFAAVLVLTGLVPVLYFVALVVWQASALFQAGAWVPLPAALLFTDHSLLQPGRAAPVLAFIPELQGTWSTQPAVASILGKVHAGLVFALPGLAVMGLGVQSALRQRALLRAYKQRNQDRLRRRQDYQREGGPTRALDGRREPFTSSL
jgi:hypothetical protein